MKKLLALVLALVMTMSLVTISNAAFSDADKISHDEAVDVLNTLGVINGMPDGSFAPAGNVTRAEMAKMISIIMLGDVDAAAFVGTSTGLTDIKGHWAEGYIQYCYSQGIIAGRGDGTFAPNANVTAVEAAKMLLGAIGYNATVQGYVGSDWAINVTRDAQISGFYDQLKGLSSNKALTRDEAAQMIYNAVVAKLIVKTPSLNINTGSITYNYEPSNTKSLMTETFGAVKVQGVVEANEFVDITSAGNALAKGKTRLESYSNASEVGSKLSGLTFNVSTGADVIGKDVTMYVKPATSTNSSTKATVLGSVFVSSTNNVIETYDKLKDADKAESWMKNAGLKTDASTLSIANYVKGGAYSYAANGRGVKLVAIDNDADGIVEYVMTVTKTLDKITLVNTAKKYVNLNGAGTIKNEDLSIYDGAAKNDIVLVYAAGGVTYVEKAQTITGTITNYNSDAEVTIAGTKYAASALANNSGKGNLASVMTNTSDTGTFYLDDAGNIIAADLTSGVTAQNTAFVAKVNASDTYGSAKKCYAFLADGTKGSYTIASFNGSTKSSDIANVTAGKLYVYELTDKGIALRDYQASSLANTSWAQTTTAVTSLDLNGTVAGYTASMAIDEASATSTTVYADKDTVFYLHDTAKDSSPAEDTDVAKTGFMKVVVGYSALAKTDTTYNNVQVAYKTVNGTKIALAVYGEKSGAPAVAASSKLVFVPNTDWTKNGDNYDISVVFTGDTEATTITSENLVAVGLYTYTKDAKGVYKLGTDDISCNYTGKLTNVTDSLLYVGGTQLNKLGDAKVFDVTDGKVTETSVSFIGDNTYGFAVVDNTTDKNVVAVYVVGKYDFAPTTVGTITAGTGVESDPFVVSGTVSVANASSNISALTGFTVASGKIVVEDKGAMTGSMSSYNLVKVSGKNDAGITIATMFYALDIA